MKVEKAERSGGVRRVGIAAYARRTEAVREPAAVPATASVLGIPEEEFTPRVRDAIMTLMGEVDALRQELADAKKRLTDAEKAADRDQLLPLLNRRAFVRELMRYISFADRYGTSSTLIYFDLDDFKTVNDTHGHNAGDAVLNHFSNLLLANVRDSDVVGRLGGDEFGVLLSHASVEQGRRKAALFSELMEKTPAMWNDVAIPVHFSYGAFELKAGDTAESAIARADEAMYAHKRGER